MAVPSQAVKKPNPHELDEVRDPSVQREIARLLEGERTAQSVKNRKQEGDPLFSSFGQPDMAQDDFGTDEYGDDVSQGQEQYTQSQLNDVRRQSGKSLRQGSTLAPNAKQEADGNNESQNAGGAASQSQIAQKLQKLSRKRRAMYEHAQMAQKAKQAKDTVKRYKELRNILRIAKVGTGISVVGIVVAVLIANIEMIVHFFYKKYPYAAWETRLTLFIDALALMSFIFSVVMVVILVQIARFGLEALL
jgi:hypothetical protein